MEKAGGGLRKIEVPAEWKITFGMVAPGAKSSGGYDGHSGWCLRFYESKEKPRAVFTDVKSFREITVPVTERITKTRSKRLNRNDPTGTKDTFVEARVSRWVDPLGEGDDDEDAEDFLALTEEAGEL
jgi:hypothetical protein